MHHNREARTFEARINDDVAGVIVYERSAGRTVLTHTIVEPKFRGQGVGSELVRATLEMLRTAVKLEVLARDDARQRAQPVELVLQTVGARQRAHEGAFPVGIVLLVAHVVSCFPSAI